MDNLKEILRMASGPWQRDHDSRPDMEWNIHVIDHDFNRVCFMAHGGGLSPERDEARSKLVAMAPDLAARVLELEEENARLNAIINAPENDDFIRGVSIEAEHQRQRWSVEHDGSKNGWDWFWTIGYLSQKAAASFQSGDFNKAKHHCISTAALMKTFHGYVEARAALNTNTN